jgi:hypothetical protein
MLHHQELNNLHALHNIIRVTELRRMIWTGHVACVKEMRNPDKISVRKLQGKRPLRRLHVDGITLIWVLGK